MFSDCQIVLELTGFSFKKKTEVKKKVKENGGIISYCITKKSTHVVCNDAEKADSSYKCMVAGKYGVPVVSLDFIHDCVQQGRLLSPESYSICPEIESVESVCGEQGFKKTISSGLSSGKIPAIKDENAKRKKTNFDPKKIYMQSWTFKHKAAPPFDEENHEVAKFALFKSSDGKSMYTLEVHVADTVDENNMESYKYRVYYYFMFSYYNQGKPGCQIPVQKCYYFKTAKDATEAYAFLYNQQIGSPHNMKVFYEPVPRDIGSPKLQQLVEEYGLDVKPLPASVAELVEHIWKEATGEIEKEIVSPLKNIKLEQVEKAEAILLKLKDATDNKQRTDLVSEFYISLPHRDKYMPADREMRSWLSKKQDICQMIKDMVSVSEATNWSTRSSTDAKYRALRCRIDDLQPTEQEYRQIKEHIIKSLKKNDHMTIENIYCLKRRVEHTDFRKDLEPQKLLFHASKVQNFVGILSRGLLLPKIVVDDHGGSRTDAGMLGTGIYFASSASTSIQYSDQSKHKGTRMMLVSNVALGNCNDYTEYHKDLQGPPEGFDSCHGVASTETEPSQFKDDEYVVYDTKQQMVQYLVEFSIKGDRKNLLFMEENCMEEKKDEAEHEEKVDLKDVINIQSPLDKVEAGLVSTSGEACTMRAVHVRAKLMDLAAKVVVLQEYHNTSSSTIEAKYVFPLDDMAAVCGFEAFINGKHIVGEVKEKETAHKEYKKAISEGHGAYLMDQDEETPEVFTVSVGNLPPHCVVLIKITYVAELQVDHDEHIIFSLPGSVAPWKAENSTLQQDTETSSVQVSIQMPFDIRYVLCPTHRILKKVTATNYMVELDDKMSTNLSNGFQLLVSLAEIHVPRMWVEVDEEGNQTEAAMLTFYPEFEAAEDNEIEVILVLDLSNSMKGTALMEAKKVLLLTLKYLPDNSLFNIVVFGTGYIELFPKSQKNSSSALTTAQDFIQNIQANMGSTEVYRPLHSFYLLKQDSSLQNVFLVSDGHINNEEATLKSVHGNCQHTRIFTFGVSSAPNKHALKAISRLGAGSFEYFDAHAKSKWEGKVKSQIHKASQPVLTSVSVAWQQYSDPPPIQAPQQITALFNGSRLVVYGFVNNCKMATLKAEIGGQEISTVVSTSDLSQTKGKMLHCMTAKAIIRDWEDGVLAKDSINHQMKKMDMKDYIIELSKKYSIVTQLTSFIAVEKREKDEIIPTDGPSIDQLVGAEDVDSLPYISWQQEAVKEDAQYYSSETKEEEDNDATSTDESSDMSLTLLNTDIWEDFDDSPADDHFTEHRMKDTDAEEDVLEAFAVFDNDDSGTIKPEELVHIMSNLGETITEDEIAEMIQDAPVEKSRKINYREFYKKMIEEDVHEQAEQLSLNSRPEPCAMMTPIENESEDESEDEEMAFGLFEDYNLDEDQATTTSDESENYLGYCLFDEMEKTSLSSSEALKCHSGIHPSQPPPPPPKSGFKPSSKKINGTTTSLQTSRKTHGGLTKPSQVAFPAANQYFAAPMASTQSSNVQQSSFPKEPQQMSPRMAQSDAFRAGTQMISSSPLSPQNQRGKVYLASPSPSIMVSGASPEKHKAVKLSVPKEKKSSCMGTPDLGYMSGKEQSPWQHSDKSPTPCFASPVSVNSSTFDANINKFVDEPQARSLKISKQKAELPLSPQPLPLSALEETTPLSSLSVPEQRMSKVTPTHPLPLQMLDTPPGAPKPRQRSRRTSEEQSSIVEELRSSETRRLSVDLTKEMIAETRKMSSSFEELRCMNRTFEDLSCEVDESLDQFIDEMMSNDAVEIIDESPSKPMRKLSVYEKRKKKKGKSSVPKSGGKDGGNNLEGYSDEEDLFMYQRTASDQPEVTYKLTDYGIGTVIKPIKSTKSQFSKKSLDKLFELQREDGSWSLTEDLCTLLGVRHDVCMEILVDAGIQSLAKRVQDDIKTLLATCIAILLIIQLESPDLVPAHAQEDFWKHSLPKWLAESIEGGSQEVDEDHFPPHERMIKTVRYYYKKELDCRWASSILELGNSWGEVAAKMLDVA